jgi:hypothetical protein
VTPTVGWATLLTATLVSASAQATPPSPVTLSATPMLGADATAFDGWTAVLARVENVSDAPFQGTLRISSPSPWSLGVKGAISEAPVRLPPKGQALVPLLARIHSAFGASMQVEMYAGDDLVVGTAATASASLGPLLVEVSSPPRLVAPLRGWPMVASWGAPLRGASTAVSLAVSSPSFDPTTGDPLLPDRPAAYASATVVLVPSDILARLPERSQRALARYVLAGGTLAVAPRRPEDLRTGILPALVGGAAKAVPPGIELLEKPAVERPEGPLPEPPDPDEEEGPPAVPLAYHPAAAQPTGATPMPVGPSVAVRSHVSGYTGGNLHASEFGATAAYGLGEVHLLGFDPTERPMVDDPWIHGRILALVERAWDRRSIPIFPHGWSEADGNATTEVRKALDPNEGFRPALAVATVLLVLYGVLAGPVLFLRAQRKNRPLLPLAWLPVASAVAVGVIVVLGLWAKGFRGRSRRIALIDAAAGLEVAAVRRYRGLFSSHSESLTVTASSTDAVIGVLATEGHGSTTPGILEQTSESLALTRIPSLPWQTVVVQEDDFTSFGQGVAMGEKDGGIVFVNGTGRALRDVLVFAPAEGYFYFADVPNGERRAARDGQKVAAPSARPRTSVGSLTVHPLDYDLLERLPEPEIRDRMREAWTPFTRTLAEQADWFPDDVPVLLGETDDPQAPPEDSGLRLERSRVLVRVVGRGGAP